MKKQILSLAALGTLGLALVGCNGGTQTNTPLPPPTAGPNTTQYVQIELLARPAVKEVFERFVDHQITNSVEPYNDPTLQNSIVGFTNTVRPPKASVGSNYGNALGSILYPNTYAVDLTQSGKASYLGVETGGATGGKFGGRDPADNVVDISLGALFGGTLPALKVQPEDNEENNCLLTENVKQAPSQMATSTFPYMPAPH